MQNMQNMTNQQNKKFFLSRIDYLCFALPGFLFLSTRDPYSRLSQPCHSFRHPLMLAVPLVVVLPCTSRGGWGTDPPSTGPMFERKLQVVLA